MSLISRFSHWLALRLRPAEPGPDARDLNLPQAMLSDGLPGPGPEAPPEPELRRRVRLAHWRAGPWQQK